MIHKLDENRHHSDAMGDQGNRNTRPSSSGGFFEIRVKGHLDGKWAEWLESLEVELLENGETLLTGVIVDQAALMGVLNKLNRLNVTILSVGEGSHGEARASIPSSERRERR